MEIYRLTRSYMGMIFSVFVLWSSSESLQAQPVRFGVEASVSQVSADFDEPQRGWHEPDIDKTINAMIFVDIPLRKQLAVQPGVRFSRYVTSVEYEHLVYGGDVVGHDPGIFKITQRYLSVPVRLKYTFDSIYILGGPELAYLVSARVKDKVQLANIGTVEGEASLTPEFHRFNLSLNAGIGYAIKVKGSAFYVQGQYASGLTRLNKLQYYATYLPESWRSREISISIGGLF